MLRTLTLLVVVIALCTAPAALGQTQTRPDLADLWSEYPLEQGQDGLERLQTRERDGSIAGPPPPEPQPGGPIALGILYAMLAVFALVVLLAIRRIAGFPRRRRASGSSLQR
jgi:hypothetical protein